MPLRFIAIHAYDITGQDANARVEVVERDPLDRDLGTIATVSVRLTADERAAFQAVRDRARAKYQARIDKATADRQADAAAPVNLDAPIDGEDA
jgi:hypothetical protein